MHVLPKLITIRTDILHMLRRRRSVRRSYPVFPIYGTFVTLKNTNRLEKENLIIRYCKDYGVLMRKSLMNNESTQVFEPVSSGTEITRPHGTSSTNTAARPLPSYHPTRWSSVNKALDITDRYSGGRADWVQRFVSYAFIGGCAAIVNLIVFYIVYNKIALPVSPFLHIMIANVIRRRNFYPREFHPQRLLYLPPFARP